MLFGTGRAYFDANSALYSGEESCFALDVLSFERATQQRKSSLMSKILPS